MDNVQTRPQSARPDYRSQVLRLMWRSHPGLTFGSAAVGIVSGFASIAVIDTINSAIHNVADRPRLLLIFIGLNLLAILCRNGSSMLPSYASIKIMTSLRI